MCAKGWRLLTTCICIIYDCVIRLTAHTLTKQTLPSDVYTFYSLLKKRQIIGISHSAFSIFDLRAKRSSKSVYFVNRFWRASRLSHSSNRCTYRSIAKCFKIDFANYSEPVPKISYASKEICFRFHLNSTWTCCNYENCWAMHCSVIGIVIYEQLHLNVLC